MTEFDNRTSKQVVIPNHVTAAAEQEAKLSHGKLNLPSIPTAVASSKDLKNAFEKAILFDPEFKSALGEALTKAKA